MQYQNLFTRVQPVGPTHHGVELGPQNSARDIEPFLLHLAGRLGNAQIGPF
jgi:photosynthetic reaction center M subunit